MKPSVRRSQQQDLIDAWHGPESATAIARRLGLGGRRVVLKYFADLKRTGQLPYKVRPCFAQTEVDVPANDRPGATDSAFAVSIDRDVEISERLAEQTGLRIEIDGLLAALERHHGTDRRRRVDDNASSLLTAHERGHLIPSPGMLMHAARVIDRTMKRLGA